MPRSCLGCKSMNGLAPRIELTAGCSSCAGSWMFIFGAAAIASSSRKRWTVIFARTYSALWFGCKPFRTSCGRQQKTVMVESDERSTSVRVFISHSDEDRLLANQIATRLKKAGNHVWFDESEIEPEDNLLRRIGEALDSSDAMVVIVSPAAGNSRVVREEVSYAIASKKFRNRLIPVIVKP